MIVVHWNQWACSFRFSMFHLCNLITFLILPGDQKDEEIAEAAKWLDPYALANRGIFASYLSVGFGLYFILTPLTFYMVRSSLLRSKVINTNWKSWNSIPYWIFCIGERFIVKLIDASTITSILCALLYYQLHNTLYLSLSHTTHHLLHPLSSYRSMN